MAKINPRDAFLRIIKDSPDGINIISVQRGLGFTIEKTMSFVNEYLEKKVISEFRLGRSRVLLWVYKELQEEIKKN